MCEKPISVDVITTESVLAKAKSKPHLKFLVPFCRRCETCKFERTESQADHYQDDESYRAAKELVENGSLGEIHAVETTCLDQQDPTGKSSLIQHTPFGMRLTPRLSGFFVTFSAQSGGIFVDMGVHDVWYFPS